MVREAQRAARLSYGLGRLLELVELLLPLISEHLQPAEAPSDRGERDEGLDATDGGERGA
jgi:hypothetical protein